MKSEKVNATATLTPIIEGQIMWSIQAGAGDGAMISKNRPHFAHEPLAHSSLPHAEHGK